MRQKRGNYRQGVQDAAVVLLIPMARITFRIDRRLSICLPWVVPMIQYTVPFTSCNRHISPDHKQPQLDKTIFAGREDAPGPTIGTDGTYAVQGLIRGRDANTARSP